MKVLPELEDSSFSEPSPGPQNLHLSKGFGAEVKVLPIFQMILEVKVFSEDFGQIFTRVKVLRPE